MNKGDSCWGYGPWLGLPSVAELKKVLREVDPTCGSYRVSGNTWATRASFSGPFVLVDGGAFGGRLSLLGSKTTLLIRMRERWWMRGITGIRWK